MWYSVTEPQQIQISYKLNYTHSDKQVPSSELSFLPNPGTGPDWTASSS